MYENDKKIKKDKTIRTLMIVLMCVCGAVFLFAGYKVISALSKYNEAKGSYEDLRDTFYVTPKKGEKVTDANGKVVPTAADEEDVFIWDFEKLKALNSDAVGYLRMRGTMDEKVDYPVVQGADNDYYLEHVFTGETNQSGCLFVDARQPDGMDSKNCIIYGHNMRGGSRMFASLNEYKDEKFFNTHPEFDVYIGEKHYVYRVFAQGTVGIDSFVYTLGFGSDSAFYNFIKQALAMNSYDMGMYFEDFGPDEHIITMSTCLDNYTNYYRYVVLMVRDREITDEEED